jgi:ABC-type branched-subunit amino acid transport system substrate-binding protein
MRTFGRLAPVAVSLALLGAACTSDPDEGGDGGGGTTAEPGAPVEGSTTGLTDDTIRIGVIGADFAALADTGLVPDLGDQPAIFESIVEEINDDGGIGGRQIELRLRLVDGLSGPEEFQAACLEMTQDFEAFAVILTPAISRDIARCTAVTNETLTMNATGFDQALYDEAAGRMFSTSSSTSMTTDRQYAGWATLLDEAGELDGATIGVITAEQAPEFPAAVESALVPTLEELGHAVAANVNLPCPEGDRDCDQHEAAIQQMKDAGVDFVFMAAPNLIGPSVVQAAINLDFHPQWAANGNQVTDTVSQFFESVADEWDGAVGTSTVFAQVDDLTPEAHDCNEVITARSGETYEPESDAFGFAAVNCLTLRTLRQAVETLDAAAVNQASVIQALEGLGEVVLNAGPNGTISADKHDAGDYLFLVDFSAADGEWIDRQGEPQRVDG